MKALQLLLAPDTNGAFSQLQVEAYEELTQLLRIEAAARELMKRLDNHFGGTAKSYDWKEQAELRSALDTEKG